ncbi:hypothetical protein BC835DRAFT_1270255 [Cytidiella melzeri]|nr:hypothetical protein BC835DRAFT_1270255 [Cytidiella melzeri]
MAAPYAFVTLLTSDSYLPGALALVAALKDLHPTPPTPPEVDFQTVCLVTPETVDVASIKLLRGTFNVVVGVEIIEQEDEMNLRLLGRPDLSTVLTKLHTFRLTQYSKVIFLDADVLPIRPMSHLFTLPHEFSAVPDVGWPDIFNSGVLVLSPGQDKFDELIKLQKTKGSWDGGDQGLLNEWRGSDWNRLSFVYNTTPTAAYTYAPAYERFGSGIAAIHFIGKEKPWKGLLYRSPGIKRPEANSQNGATSVYNYEALVDRWYDVYDTHYRQEPTFPKNEFSIPTYSSVWDDGTSLGAEFPAAGALPASGSGYALGLDDLRKAAIEGLNTISRSSSSSLSSSSSHGEYVSMPLDGRVDLMRPQKLPDPELNTARGHHSRDTMEQQEGVATTFESSHTHTPAADSEYFARPMPPTPAPHEVPNAPYMHGHSLPPTATPTPYYGPPSGSGSGQQQRAAHLNNSLQRDHEPSRSHGQRQHHYPQSEQHVHFRPDPVRMHEHQHHQPHQHSRPPPPRPSSPPKSIWNPAIEPPPKQLPPISAFPEDTYFTNVWDQPHDATHQSSPSPDCDGRADVFFRPPPPPIIPEQLIREGQYANVLGYAEQSHNTEGALSPPVPDKSKVHAVFPWEEKPRHIPRRVFPSSDSPAAATYIESERTSSPVSTPPAPLPLQVHAVTHVPSSPVQGIPWGVGFSNAWDTVPSIQKYASKLAGSPKIFPHLFMTPPPPPADDNWRKQWREQREKDLQDRHDASSMDGDDEDEDDSEEEHQSESTQKGRGGGGGPSKRRETTSKSKKQYRTRGVQASPQTNDKDVQVEIIKADGDLRRVSVAALKRASQGLRRQWQQGTPYAPGSTLMPSAVPRDFMTEPEQVVGTPLVNTFARSGMPFPSMASPTGLRSPATLGSPGTYSPPRLHSPRGSTPSPRHSRMSSLTSPFVPSLQRAPSADTYVAPSPSATNESISTPGDTPVEGRSRTGSRVWDPARGVDVFKRGSEEVLSRFLRMGSFDDDEGKQRQRQNVQ